MQAHYLRGQNVLLLELLCIFPMSVFRYNSLLKFFEQFCAVLSSLRNERDHATLMAMVKKRVDLQDPIVIKYSTILTPYALGFVSKQLALRKKINIVQEFDIVCLVSSSQGILKVDFESCQCSFWNTTQLPCRHIFAVREKRHLPLFVPDIVADRWTLDHLKTTYNQKMHGKHSDSFEVRLVVVVLYICT